MHSLIFWIGFKHSIRRFKMCRSLDACYFIVLHRHLQHVHILKHKMLSFIILATLPEVIEA